MNTNVINYLKKEGYKIDDKPYGIIKTCNSWYVNEDIEGFHDRKTVQNTTYHLQKTNMAKRCCADDANLCEVINLTAEDERVNSLVASVLEDNNFYSVLREQLELVAATGTAGTYIRIINADVFDNGTVKKGEIELNYVKASQIIPLKIKNNQVIDCAFYGLEGKRHAVVKFIRNGDIYTATTQYFSKDWKKEEQITVEYPEGCKPFALLRTAGVNNIAGMEGFGVPKIYNAIGYLKGVDLAWNTFIRDLEKADKLVLMNEKMLKFDDSGKPIRPSNLANELFCFLGEKLPDEKSLVQEYNPSIRVDEITKAMEFSLSMLSNMFGYGTRKYSFENGQIKTATEYIGERQDLMQELNKQRENVKGYILELIRNSLVLYKFLHSLNIDPTQAITIDFDDSYINDRQSQLKAIQEDVGLLGLVEIQVKYLTMKYNISEEEAKSWIEGKTTDDNEDEEV